MNIITVLQGKKSYIGFTALFFLGGAYAIGVIDLDTFIKVGTMVASLTGIAMRAGMAKSQ